MACQKDDVRLELEVMQLDELGSLSYVRMKRITGEMQSYREVAGKVLALAKL